MRLSKKKGTLHLSSGLAEGLLPYASRHLNQKWNLNLTERMKLFAPSVCIGSVTLSYGAGSHECTDSSRLVLRAMTLPDSVASTSSTTIIRSFTLVVLSIV